MTERLSDMVREETPPETVFEGDELEPKEETVESAGERKEQSNDISITSLSSWFELNYKNFENINPVKVSIKGVNPDSNLLMAAVCKPEREVSQGVLERELFLFKDADAQPVLNIPGMDMQIYNNGFKVVYEFEDIYLKGYGIRTGLMVSFCNNIDGRLIPYEVMKVSKRDTNLEIVRRDPVEVRQRLLEKVDIEALELLYRQSNKVEGLETNYDAVSWLLARQAEVTDISHHLQIDNVIIAMLA
jgi:hypothetical protein